VNSLTTRDKTNLDELAASIVNAFPSLNVFEQRLSLELYRLLAAGEPVSRDLLAGRLQARIELVDRTLDAWPGVFSDGQRRIVGYWGLSIATAYTGPHHLIIDGRGLSAWCAWDTIFLPQLLGKRVEVESTSPPPAGTVKLTVTPAGVEHVEPADVHVSFLVPDATGVRKDIVSTFCHYIHFFPSRQAGEAWAAQHPGTFILSVTDAVAIARSKNNAQYSSLLG
jgi:alkylmercury lyase